MYAIHVVCLSVRQTFAYCIPLYNASHFLDSLVVCCTQELSSIGRRGLYLSVSKPCCPVWSVSSETAAAAGGGVGGRVSDTWENPKCFQCEGPENLSWAQRNKYTNNIAICLCSFIDPGSCFGSKKGNPQMCFNFKCCIPFRHVTSCLFSFSPSFVFRQSVLQCPRMRL